MQIEKARAQNLVARDYFDLFGLERSFYFESAHLETAYRRLLLVLHPDRFAAAGASERGFALQATAYLNRAYQVLNDAVERAAYLLELEGIVPAAERTLSDTAFLVEQMDFREQLVLGQQSSEALEFLEKLAGRVNKRTAEVILEFEQQYQTKNFSEAESSVQKLRFLKKLEKEIKSGLRSAEGGTVTN